MKAIFFERHGDNSVLQYGERPTPEPGAGEVRVAIRAAALNHLDIFVRNGVPGVMGSRPAIVFSCNPGSTATPASSVAAGSRVSA